MNLKIKYQTLKAVLREIADFAGSNASTLAVLRHVLISPRENQALLACTNLNCFAYVTLPAVVDLSGAPEGLPGITVPVAPLLALLSAMPAVEEVKLSFDPKTAALKIVAGGSSTTLKGLPEEEFPPAPGIPEGEGVATLTLAQGEWAALNRAAYAAARDESRPALTGVLLDTTSGNLVAVSADGFHISVKAIAANVGKGKQAILPLEAVEKLNKILSGKGAVKARLDAARILVTWETSDTQGMVGGSLLAMEYPDVSAILKSAAEAPRAGLLANRDQLLAGLRQAEIFAREDHNTVTITPQEGGFALQAESDSGSTSAVVKAELTGSLPNVAVNARFLRDAVESISAEMVLVQFVGAKNLTWVYPAQAQNGGGFAKDPSQLGLIMPMAPKPKSEAG